MAFKKAFPILPFGVFVFVVIAISAGIFAFVWISDETHDAKYAKDYNALGKHACPDKRDKRLQFKLEKNQNRPDEDELWNFRLIGFSKDQEQILRSTTDENRDVVIQNSKENMENLLNHEYHYRVEVRRTILEIEANHPVFVYPICDDINDYNFIKSTGLTYSMECCTGYPSKAAAHDRGRTDTIIWYVKHGIFPVNYKPSSSQEPPA